LNPQSYVPKAYSLFPSAKRYILKGEGLAYCDGKVVSIQAGDSLMVPPTGTHVIENTGKGRMYALCIMIPNENFAELIRSGIPVELDAEDLEVLRRSDRAQALVNNYSALR